MSSLSKEAVLVHEALVARGLETPMRAPVQEIDNETRKRLITGHMTEIMQLLNLDLSDDASNHVFCKLLQNCPENCTCRKYSFAVLTRNRTLSGKCPFGLHPRLPCHTKFIYNATFTCQTIVFYWKVLYTHHVRSKYCLPKCSHI